MKILTCNANRPLAEAMSNYLDLPLTKASVRCFSDMEVFVEIHENVRGEDVFVIQSTSYPANDHLMELLVSLDAQNAGDQRRLADPIPLCRRGAVLTGLAAAAGSAGASRVFGRARLSVLVRGRWIVAAAGAFCVSAKFRACLPRLANIQ